MKGYFLFGQNPGRRRAERRPAPRRAAQPRLARGRRLVRDRERRLLEGDPTGPPPGEVKTEVFFIPAAAGAGEGRQPHQHAAAAPVARQGARPARRLPLRRLVRLQPRQAPQAALRRLDRPAGPAAARTSPGTTTSTSTPRLPDGTLSRIEGEPDLEKVLQEINGYSLTRSTRARAAAARQRLLRAEGRRLDGVRLLDLQRRLPRAGPQPRARAQAHATTRSQPEWGFAWPHNRRDHVQPRLGRPGGPAVVGAQEAASGGTTEQRRWVGLDEPDFEPEKPPDYRPPPGAKGMAAIAGDAAVHHEARRPRLAVRPRRGQGRPAADALRAGRVAGGQPALPEADVQPDGAVLRGAAQPAGARADAPSTRWSPPRSG